MTRTIQAHQSILMTTTLITDMITLLSERLTDDGSLIPSVLLSSFSVIAMKKRWGQPFTFPHSSRSITPTHSVFLTVAFSIPKVRQLLYQPTSPALRYATPVQASQVPPTGCSSRNATRSRGGSFRLLTFKAGRLSVRGSSMKPKTLP